jgi:hypothetical protein
MRECCPETCNDFDEYNDEETPLTKDTDKCLDFKGFASTSKCSDVAVLCKNE